MQNWASMTIKGALADFLIEAVALKAGIWLRRTITGAIAKKICSLDDNEGAMADYTKSNLRAGQYLRYCIIL